MTYYPDRSTLGKNINMISFSDFDDKSRLYIRHSNSWLRLDQFQNNDNDQFFREDASFMIIPALNGAQDAVSFQSVKFPTYHIRHQNYYLRIDPSQDDKLYKDDASFFIRTGLDSLKKDQLVSIESVNFPEHYWHLQNGQFVIKIETDANFHKKQATFTLKWPLSKSIKNIVFQSELPHKCKVDSQIQLSSEVWFSDEYRNIQTQYRTITFEDTIETFEINSVQGQFQQELFTPTWNFANSIVPNWDSMISEQDYQEGIKASQESNKPYKLLGSENKYGWLDQKTKRIFNQKYEFVVYPYTTTRLDVKTEYIRWTCEFQAKFNLGKDQTYMISDMSQQGIYNLRLRFQEIFVESHEYVEDNPLDFSVTQELFEESE